MNYDLAYLQAMYGRDIDEVSRHAKPLNLEKLTGKWRPIAEEAIRFVVDSYNVDSIPLSIRQVHYHLVHEPLGYVNDLKHANRLTTLILRARLANLIQWHMISEEESTVYSNEPAGADPEQAIKEALESAKYATGKNPWKAMGKYVVVFSEKRELGPQLEAITSKYYLRFICTRGYGMWSRFYREAERIKNAIDEGLECYALFVTDHDPSGLDLNRFAVSILKNYWKLPVNEIRVMLNMDQIKSLDVLAAPVKIKDPRAKWYTKVFGTTSWEVDALGKEGMQRILEDKILSLIDADIWDSVMEENEENIRKTEELARKILGKRFSRRDNAL